MKADKLRELDTATLKEQVDGYYKELFNLRFQAVTGKLTATGRQRVVRREIARIKTILHEREQA
ncbi:MAG: 50S ribosomal protein L29 [Roseiflexaceae bacterium]|jgi:large subunit ribosomal protein L29